MSLPPATAVKLALPRWAYVPGETDEADADYETLAQVKLLVPSRFRDFVPALLKTKLTLPVLSKADWVAIGVVGRI